jgi:membrane associated rhomboid family serine protease
MNWLVVTAVILVFWLQIAELGKYSASARGAEQYVENSITMQYSLDGWGIKGLLGSMWLHGGILHVMGNLLYLWLFGNAVCSKLGNLRYLSVYLVLGVASGIGHLLFSEGRAAGASGAISGLIGMHLVFFPENSISCFFCWIFLPHRPVWFSFRSLWFILPWFALNVYGAMRGGGRVGYFAHIGGFVTGVGLALLLLKTKCITMEKHERSMLDLLGLGGKKARPTAGRGDRTRWQRKWEIQERMKALQETSPAEPEETSVEFIRFKCSCGQPIKVSGQYAGRTGRCPKCARRVKIPPT